MWSLPPCTLAAVTFIALRLRPVRYMSKERHFSRDSNLIRAITLLFCFGGDVSGALEIEPDVVLRLLGLGLFFRGF